LINKLFAITFCLIAQLASAGQFVQHNSQCTCDPTIHDEFEQTLSFGFGPFKGQCVDACKFRGPTFVSARDALHFGADTNHAVVANVLHHHHYWIARIPLTGVVEVDADFERFLSKISHSVLRFRFARSEPVLLYRQDGNWRKNYKKPANKIYDLVLSAEAVPPIHHSFDFVESSFGSYLLDYRLLSIDDTVSWMIDDKHHSVKQFALNLDSPLRKRLLRGSLSASTQKSFKSAYNLFTNNCATSIMNVMDQEIGYQPSVLDWLRLVKIQRALPIDSYFGTIYALGAMRLLSDQSQKPNLEEEFRRVL
jgi:hypothetical protein